MKLIKTKVKDSSEWKIYRQGYMHEIAERARNNPLVIIGRYNIEYSSFKEPIPVTQAMADSNNYEPIYV